MPHIDTTHSFLKKPSTEQRQGLRQRNDINTLEYIKIARLLARAGHVICKGDDKRLDFR